MKNRKQIIQYILLLIFLILMAVAIYFYKEYNRKHKDTAMLRPDYSLVAANLVKEFETNEQLSNKKYVDKVIQVEGIVKDIIRDERGLYTLVIGDTSSMSSVRCGIDSVHTKEIAVVKKGSSTNVKGICSGFNADEMLGSDVLLVRAVIDSKK